jgi:outer membrane receptor protein involved in Fe transport
MPRLDPGTRPRALALALSLALAPAAARAQSEDKVEIADVDLESLLDLSIESVALHEERASEASASVFVLSGDDLRRQGFRTLHEALRTVPGMFGYADGLYPMIGVRGIGNLEDFTTRILVLVDGHPLNNSLAIGESYLGRDLPIPLAAVRRLEVIKGPVGSLYGPTAYLGVVNLVTSGGLEGVEVSAYGDGAQGAFRAGGATAVASGRSESVSWLVSGEGYGTRGLEQAFPELAARTDVPVPPGGRIPAGADFAGAGAGYGRVAWRGITASASCGDFRRGLASAPWSSQVGDDRNTLQNRTCFAQLALTRDLSRTFGVDARAAYDRFEYWDTLIYPAPPTSFGTFKDYGLDSWFSGGARGTWRPASGTRLMAGATVEAHDTIQHSYSLDLPENPVTGVGVGVISKNFVTLTTYLLAQQAVADSLTLHAGLTFHENDIFGHRFTPKLAAVWHPTHADTLKAIWSNGFRAPTAAEAFFEDGSSYLANPSLRSETVRSLELVYERRLSRLGSVAASVFQNNYRDLIHFVSVPAPGVTNPSGPDDYRQISQNGGPLRLRGGELSATLRWREILQAWGGVSVQEVDEPRRPNFPQWTATFALSSRALWQPLTLSVNGSASAARATDPTVVDANGSPAVAATALVNAFAILDVPRAPGLSLELGVENLFQARALDPVPGDFAPISAMAGAPRAVRGGVRYRF